MQLYLFRGSERSLLGSSHFKLCDEDKCQGQNQTCSSLKLIWNMFPVLRSIFLHILRYKIIHLKLCDLSPVISLKYKSIGLEWFKVEHLVEMKTLILVKSWLKMQHLNLQNYINPFKELTKMWRVAIAFFPATWLTIPLAGSYSEGIPGVQTWCTILKPSFWRSDNGFWEKIET